MSQNAGNPPVTASTAARPRYAILVMSALVGLLAGVTAYTFYYAKGTSYLFDDPKVCVNCHIMRDEYDGWQKAGHHAVATCNDCHIPHTSLVAKYYVKAENGFHHSRAFTLQNFHEPIRIRPENARVLNRNCVRCHADFVGDILVHQGSDPDRLYCVRCHANVGHGPTK